MSGAFESVRLDVCALEARIDTPVTTSFGSLPARVSVLLNIEDADGCSGWGGIRGNFPSIVASDPPCARAVRVSVSAASPDVTSGSGPERAQPFSQRRRCFRRRPCTTFRSGSQRPQQAAPDDVALDLGGAVPDALDAGVAPEARQRQVAHQPHAAVDLDRFVGHPRQHLRGVHRFIPARAGNTRAATRSPGPRTVHPRSRGEHWEAPAMGVEVAGSSPLARGTPLPDHPAGVILRFIPARAGNTLAIA